MKIRGAASLSRRSPPGCSPARFGAATGALRCRCTSGPLPPGKSIYRIEGEVLVNGQPATPDTQIAANATVETGKNSEAIYVVGETAYPPAQREPRDAGKK